MVKRIPKTEGQAAFDACISSLNPSSAPIRDHTSGTRDSLADATNNPIALIGQTAPAPAPTPNPSRETLATAVRWSLQELAERAPGRAVEVRVPPFGAVQILQGTTHRRGTPPAVVEVTPETWIRLAAGELNWDDALADGSAKASGQRANLSALLPLEF